MSNVHHVAVMNVMADDLRFRVQSGGAIEVHVGDQVTLYPGTVTGSLDAVIEELSRIGRRLVAEAIRLRAERSTSTTEDSPYSVVGEVTPEQEQRIDHEVMVAELDRNGDLASLDARDPGPEPVVIDVDGTEVAA